jgi:hypothetical protein
MNCLLLRLPSSPHRAGGRWRRGCAACVVDRVGAGEHVEPGSGSMRLAKRSRTQSPTSSSAAGMPAGSLPPAWAMSGRPPPRPPTFSAATLTRSPALKRSVRSLVTPAMRLTLPSLSVASSTTPEPTLFLSWSMVSRSDLGSAPSSRAASTLTPSTSTVWSARSLPAALASLALSCSSSFSSRASAPPAARPCSSTSAVPPLTSSAMRASRASSSSTQSSARSPATASMRRTPELMPPSEVILNRPMSPTARTWVPPHSSVEKPPMRSTRTCSRTSRRTGPWRRRPWRPPGP